MSVRHILRTVTLDQLFEIAKENTDIDSSRLFAEPIAGKYNGPGTLILLAGTDFYFLVTEGEEDVVFPSHSTIFTITARPGRPAAESQLGIRLIGQLSSEFCHWLERVVEDETSPDYFGTLERLNQALSINSDSDLNQLSEHSVTELAKRISTIEQRLEAVDDEINLTSDVALSNASEIAEVREMLDQLKEAKTFGLLKLAIRGVVQGATATLGAKAANRLTDQLIELFEQIAD